jgi:hypothetical protein
VIYTVILAIFLIAAIVLLMEAWIRIDGQKLVLGTLRDLLKFKTERIEVLEAEICKGNTDREELRKELEAKRTQCGMMESRDFASSQALATLRRKVCAAAGDLVNLATEAKT